MVCGEAWLSWMLRERVGRVVSRRARVGASVGWMRWMWRVGGWRGRGRGMVGGGRGRFSIGLGGG